MKPAHDNTEPVFLCVCLIANKKISCKCSYIPLKMMPSRKTIAFVSTSSFADLA